MNKNKHHIQRRPIGSPFLYITRLCVPVVVLSTATCIGCRAHNTFAEEISSTVSKTIIASETNALKSKGTSPDNNENSKLTLNAKSISNPYIVDVYNDELYMSNRNLDEVGISYASRIFGELSNKKYTEEAQELLLQLTMAEAGGETVEGKALVIRVIFNRVLSEEFPDTMEGVIYEEHQFEPVGSGIVYDMIPSETCYEALDMVILDGWDESQGAVYFEATRNGSDTWHTNNLEYLMTVGGHSFYK